ncbi:Hypothetical protein NCS54_00856300 [Fusarium falciforme]|uniref:Hypothetical protein n=1 Tax=Fusarium falciforme TaxID=195108 RepID=UPI0023017072|nr:Hypothetical protein NCS54_00856300 [Fusarium falciforme]WAO91110.1 Hypothetical protein NCS54_00856300 [Fusarium falciforme]
MAEVLGIVAGAAQLVDLSTRVLVASSSLYGKLKNIPDEIETLKKNTELFIDLLWMISSDFDGPITSQVHTLHVTHRITSILHDARKESEELALLLEGLSSNNSSSMRRKWSAVSSSVIDSNRAILKRLNSHEDPVPFLDGHRRRRSRRNSAFCTCRPSGSSTYLSIYGLQLFCSQETTHSPNCRHRDGSTSWSCGVRALSPKIQMMVGIQLGGWTLSMVGRLSPHNVVDPGKSPAFMALGKAWGALGAVRSRGDSWDQPGRRSQEYTVDSWRRSHIEPLTVQEEVKSLFHNLLQELREAFESGTASPSDHTPNNTTLLHFFVTVAMKFVGLHELLFHVLDDIVKLLVAGNVDPNASTSGIRPFETPIFYMLINMKTTLCLQQNNLDRILINHGCNAFEILPSDEWGGAKLTTLLKKNPSLLEDHGQYPAYVATIQRSEARLSLLLMQNKIDLKTKTPSILSLAVGWTAGLQILLDAGANPDDAILTAIWEHHLPSIELLIDNGCSLFDIDQYPFGTDVFSCVYSVSASSDVMCLLAQKIAARRLELLQLASKELPETCLKRLGLRKHPHLLPSPDYNAPEVFRQLEAHKVQVPKSLWSGSLTTLYHHRHMTDTLAEALYDVGFCSIDELDAKGHSPLIEAILGFNSQKSILLAQWYLRKGCQLPRSSAYVNLLDRATGFTSSVSSHDWITKDSRLFGPLRMFQELHPEGVGQCDSCSCWCSTAGCTPVGIILRQSLGPWVTFARRQRWLFNLPRYSSLGLSLGKDTFEDICRLEIFDRLGMAHTCSHHQYNSYGSDDDSSERDEVQEEDYHLKQVLDSYLELYLCLLHTHADRFEAFWIAWWIALEYFLPFETNNICHCRRPLELDNVCDPQSYDEAQSHDSYEPNVEAITAFLADCVPQLSSETRARFLDQLKPTEYELWYLGLLIDYDISIYDIDGDWDDSD